MPMKHQYSIRLANGREQSFDNAQAMVEWMDRQRTIKPSTGKVKRTRNYQRKLDSAVSQPTSAESSLVAPLARFAVRRRQTV